MKIPFSVYACRVTDAIHCGNITLDIGAEHILGQIHVVDNYLILSLKSTRELSNC